MVKNYSKLYKYYDQLINGSEHKAELINNWINQYNPKAKTILEIACGTGTILKFFEKKYNVFGLDLSEEMLKIAKNKVKDGKFYFGDMKSFSLNKKFDVILCIFDSINHLLKFEDWVKVYKNTKMHLEKNGIFIFDVNMPSKFKKINSNPIIKEFNKDFIIDSVATEKDEIIFNTKIFEHQKNNNYKLFEEKIIERVFQKEKIIKQIENNFKILKIVDPKRKKISINSERLYFICRLKNSL